MEDQDSYMDPTDSQVEVRRSALRPAALEGRVITLLDISKVKGDHFLDRLEEILRERVEGASIIRRRKPTFARPAPDDLRQEIIATTELVIEALAD